MMTICYPVKHGLYLNITNRCPCRCTFCIRQNGDGAYGSDSLWLDHEPSTAEICDALRQFDLTRFEEVVFCGYGEPMERLDVLLQVASFLKENGAPPIRINTNGLGDLICGEKCAVRLAGKIDTVSISLNATCAEDYLAVTRSRFGLVSFDAMLSFARDCKQYVPRVMMTVVDQVTSPAEQEKARAICADLGVTLRVRPLET